jgi:hypothetical protein
MREGQIKSGQRERDRLIVLRTLDDGHLNKREAGERRVRRLLQRIRSEGDRGVLHGGDGPRIEICRCCSSSGWWGGRGNDARTSGRR